MFSGIRTRIARIRHHPEVEELCQNSAQLLQHELKRLNRKLKRRLAQAPIEPLANR